MTEEELADAELQRDREEVPPVWQFQAGGDLVALGEVLKLGSRGREVCNWYKGQCSVGFGARILDQQFYRRTDDSLFIQFKELSQFYQKLALDIHIMSLWTM
jgi:hypothetical protein